MLSPERFYLLSFLALSAGIGLALRWPADRRNWGLVAGGHALGIATLLGAYLASVGGVAALLQQPAPTLGWPALQPAFAQFWAAWQALLNTLQAWGSGLTPNLCLILLFLGVYLAIKLVLVLLAWLVHGVLKLFGGNTWPSPALPPQAAFLQDTARWSLLALALLLGALPHAMALSPILARFFEALFWAGLWIQLLELWQWLRVARIEAPEPADHADAAEEGAEPDLEPLYRAYLRLHQAPEIGDRALLFDGGIDPARAPDAPPAPFPAAGDGDIARQFYPRLQKALPPRLLEDLRHLANRYERGDDLLFAETPCGYHFLWLAELIQHHTPGNRILRCWIWTPQAGATPTVWSICATTCWCSTAITPCSTAAAATGRWSMATPPTRGGCNSARTRPICRWRWIAIPIFPMRRPAWSTWSAVLTCCAITSAPACAGPAIRATCRPVCGLWRFVRRAPCPRSRRRWARRCGLARTGQVRAGLTSPSSS